MAETEGVSSGRRATTVYVERTSESPHFGPVQRVRELTAHRHLLWNLSARDLKVKYASSLLGAAWSVLNPLVYLVAFTVIFSLILPNGVPNFPIYLLSGLLAWNFFAGSLGLGARSVVDNANLVKKVYFPREFLPLAAVNAAVVDLALQAVILIGFLIVLRYPFIGPNVLLVPLSLLTLGVFTIAMTFLVAALNVRYRDVQHLLNVLLLIWFWFTPIVYPSGLVYTRLQGHTLFGIPLFNLFLLNPVADVVLGLQRGLYAKVVAGDPPVLVLAPVSLGWLALAITVTLILSTLLLWFSWRRFFLLSGDFAEEL